MNIFAGSSILVTGGGGGFGKASARLLVRDGAAVILMGRNAERLKRARAGLLEEFPAAEVSSHVGDASNEKDVAAALHSTRVGGKRLQAVVCVVGGGAGYGKIGSIDYASFLDDYRANVGSAFLATQLALPLFENGGSIVMISSTAAKLTFPALSSYCAAKAGLEQFMRVAADELGSQGVRVNCVRPGLTHTDGLDAAFERPGYVDGFLPHIPLGRTGVPNDVAEAVRYLAGPESAWVTGQSFAVDGGNELRMAPHGAGA